MRWPRTCRTFSNPSRRTRRTASSKRSMCGARRAFSRSFSSTTMPTSGVRPARGSRNAWPRSTVGSLPCRPAPCTVQFETAPVMETYTLRRRSDAPAVQYRIDYAGELNPAQYEAATALTGPVLVIAGAGSGKTRTLVYRVARLVESGVNPGQILLLTFTRKAAEEMLRRAAALVGTSCERVAGGTFHSFANVVLRRAARHVGLEPNFTILDRGDSEDVVNLLRSRAGLDRK